MRNFVILFIDFLSVIKWNFTIIIKKLTNHEFRRTINRNRVFLNSRKADRCFIVGNGPSLNKMNLSLLADEVVFTVNNIMNDNQIYNSLNSDFHVFIDPYYFSLNLDLPEDRATLNLLSQINYPNKKPSCIVSYEGKRSIDNYGLNKILDVYYVFQHRNMLYSYPSRIDMCRNMPASQNVIQTAISSAIYMGYRKIYLIGCDMTSVFISYCAAENGDKMISGDMHAYKYSNSELKSMTKESAKHDNEFMLYEYAKTFTIFKNIRRFAETRGIEIINATRGGGLDVFKRMNYDDIFGL